METNKHNKSQAMDLPRRSLVLETSGIVGHVALAEGAGIVDVRRLDETRRHARDLVPAVAELCKVRGWRLRDIDAVMVSVGPGSYTGLRVGIMSAKTMAYATGCKLIAVPTFEAIARQTPAHVARTEVVADAQQSKIYVQGWIRTDQSWRAVSEISVLPISDWVATLQPGSWVTGPGAALVASKLPATNALAPAETHHATAQSVFAAGLERFAARSFDSYWSVEPLYQRASNAEENWDQRARASGPSARRGVGAT